jgi:microcin C transport system substrate-binding protein
MPGARLLPALLLLAAAAAAPAAEVHGAHGLAMHGALKYGPDFEHFEYANPEAPKGGTVVLSAIGTFDSLHPFILKGQTPTGITGTFDTLMVSSDDEAFSEYGLLAESVEVPADRSWVAFDLREEARFHDGTPVTADDVVFSFQALKEKGHPFYRAYYKNVAAVEKEGSHRVRFMFEDGDNRELPLIIGQLPVLPAHAFEDRVFDETTLEPLPGSGPYRVREVDPGRSVTYERVADYWGRDLPVNRGRHNFDVLRIEYYRDATVALQAFKAGEYDFRSENIAKNWATAYDFPAVRDGRVVLEEIPHDQPTGMQGFVMNTRRALFQDPRVRRAMGYAFDFQWTNQNLFYGAYTRTESYFSNSELASRGLPAPEELEILEPYRERLPEEVFTEAYEAPSTAGPGGLRANLRQAVALLEEAGWRFEGRRLVHGETGRPFEMEILLVSPSMERVALPYVRNLERIGIDASVRTVDTTQYQNRLDSFDFDMTVAVFGQSLSPGNEQRDFWGSEAAETPGSRNLAGVRDPVVDALVDLVIAAPDRESLIHRTRALDRVLLWGHYVVPHWHVQSFRIAYWNKFEHPAVTPRYALGFDTWWVDAEKAAELQ